MFSTLSDRMTVALFRLAIHTADITTTTHNTRVLGITLPRGLGLLMGPAVNTPDCATDFVHQIRVGVSNFVHVLMGIGISVSVIGIIIGGLMRATSFGNERRIAMSNTAITCAVIGLVIVIVGATVGNAIPAWFGAGDVTGCEIQNGA